MAYRSEIDGLRAVAVAAVVLNHAGFSFISGGFLGVDVFFVISGFLITGIITRELSAGTFSLVGFYERRARRILPALGTVILVVTPAAWAILTPAQLKQYGQSVASVALFSSNLLFWQQSGYFDVAAELKPLLHTWSLAVEEQFYLLFPLLLLALQRFGKRLQVGLLLSLAAGSLTYSQIGAISNWASNFYLLPSRAWELSLGVVLALVSASESRSSSGLMRQVVSSCALAALILSLVFLTKEDALPGVLSLIPVLSTGALLWSSGPGTLAYRLLTLRPMTTVGLMSYSIYLWHQPLFALARHATRSDLNQVSVICLLIATFLLSSITYRMVERPFRDRSWLPRARIFSLGALLTATFLTFGVVAQVSGGDLPGKAGAVERENQLRAMTASRTPPRGGSPCHWVARTPVESYLEGWNCGVGSDPGLRRLPVIVVGDSHASVLAGAFLWNGLSVARVSGSGCSLLPPEGRNYPECAAILDLAVNEVATQEIQTVYLANRYDDGELTTRFLELTIDFWLEVVDDVILMAPVPEFPTAHATYVNTGEIELEADFTSADRFMSIVQTMNLPESVTVVDTTRLLCGAERECRLIDGDELLWANADHLSGHGAERLGDSMIDDGLISGPDQR